MLKKKKRFFFLRNKLAFWPVDWDLTVYRRKEENVLHGYVCQSRGSENGTERCFIFIFSG